MSVLKHSIQDAFDVVRPTAVVSRHPVLAQVRDFAHSSPVSPRYFDQTLYCLPCLCVHEFYAIGCESGQNDTRPRNVPARKSVQKDPRPRYASMKGPRRTTQPASQVSVFLLKSDSPRYGIWESHF